jgi:hypothetical protein
MKVIRQYLPFALPILVIGIIAFFYALKLRELRDFKALHDNQIESLLDSSNRVTLTLRQSIDDYEKREGWVIDSAKKAGIRQGRIASVTNTGIRIEYRDTGSVKIDTVKIGDSTFFEYSFEKDTGCINYGFHIDTRLLPKVKTWIDIKIETANVEVAVAPKGILRRIFTRKKKWPRQNVTFVNCGEIFKNVKTEIK